MSRSIHTTRRDLGEAHRAVYRDQAKKRQDLRRLLKVLYRKRLTKDLVREDRRAPSGNSPIGVVDAVKIRIVDQGRYIHYPAGVADLQAVMGRLPPGVMDGISEIALGLEAEYQAEFARKEPGNEKPDPFTGRLGYEGFPGVFAGLVLGTRHANALITLSAYVYDPETPGLRDWMILLRLEALGTFVHELAHHFDHTRRVARGRWLASEEEKVESYAEEIQYEWTQEYVVPYLEATYPDEVEAVCRWVARHGGVELPLALLAGDPRRHQNALLASFNMEFALGKLALDVANGKSLTESRLTFAWQLHAAEVYDPALEAIALVLKDDPANHEARTLRADIFVHRGRFEEALTIVRGVLSEDSHYCDAWYVLVHAYEGLKQWDRVIETATEIAAHAQDDSDRLWAIWDRAAAYINKGQKVDAEADIQTLEASGPDWLKAAKRLRERLAQAK